MKRKGFTLIEVLAMLIIIAVLISITVPVVGNIIKKYRNDAYNAQIKLLEKEVRSWATANANSLPETEDDMVFLTIRQLVNGGYLKNETALDPRNNEELNGCVMVTVDPEYNNYNFEYHDIDCNALAGNHEPMFSYNGEIVEDVVKVEVNSTFIYPTVTAVSSNGRSLTVDGPTISKNGTTVDDVTTSIVGDKYTLTYSTYDSNLSYTFKKTYNLEINDTQKPVLSFGDESNVNYDVNEGYYVSVNHGDTTFKLPTAIVTDNSCGLSGTDTSVNQCSTTLKATTEGSYSPLIVDEYVITYYAVDSSKNENALILQVKVVDNTKPQIVSVSKTPDAWTSDSITLKVYATDNTSIKEYSFDNGINWQASDSKPFSTNQVVKIKVKDAYDNISDVYEVEIDKIDKVVPSATFAFVSGTKGENDWYVSDVVLRITPTAGDSGVVSYKYCRTTSSTCTPNTTITGSGATDIGLNDDSSTNKMCIATTNGAGATGSVVCSSTYKIDKNAPKITSVTPSTTEWTTDSITLTVNATDEVGVTGYSFEGGSYGTIKTHSVSSAKSVSISVKDEAGHVTSQNVTVESRTEYKLTYTNTTTETIQVNGIENSKYVWGYPSAPTSHNGYTLTNCESVSQWYSGGCDSGNSSCPNTTYYKKWNCTGSKSTTTTGTTDWQTSNTTSLGTVSNTETRTTYHYAG